MGHRSHRRTPARPVPRSRRAHPGGPVPHSDQHQWDNTAGRASTASALLRGEVLSRLPRLRWPVAVIIAAIGCAAALAVSPRASASVPALTRAASASPRQHVNAGLKRPHSARSQRSPSKADAGVLVLLLLVMSFAATAIRLPAFLMRLIGGADFPVPSEIPCRQPRPVQLGWRSLWLPRS